MYLVGFLEVAGHLGEDLAVTDADIDGEAKGIPDLVLDRMGNGNRIGVDPMCSRHIQEAFVDGVFLDHRCILTADIHESPGGCFIKPKIRSGEKQIRTLAQCHSHRFAGFDPKFLRRDRFCQDDAGPLIPIASDSRGNQPDIIFSQTDSASSFPGEIRAIHIYMENQSGHRISSSNSSVGFMI